MTKNEFEKQYREAVGKIIDGANFLIKTDPDWVLVDEKDKVVMKSIYLGLSVQMVKHSALVSLLTAKNLITEDEYNSSVCLALQTEKKRFEDYLSGKAGKKVTL